MESPLAAHFAFLYSVQQLINSKQDNDTLRRDCTSFFQCGANHVFEVLKESMVDNLMPTTVFHYDGTFAIEFWS
jgi:hypothetical protein